MCGKSDKKWIVILFFLPPLTRIASSIQKNIKEIVANDGNVNCANDRLKEFVDTATGKAVLAMAHQIMKNLKLTYTEQVFMQESGYSSEKNADVDTNRTIEEKPCAVDRLLDQYHQISKPVRR